MNFYRWLVSWLDFWFGIDLKPKQTTEYTEYVFPVRDSKKKTEVTKLPKKKNPRVKKVKEKTEIANTALWDETRGFKISNSGFDWSKADKIDIKKSVLNTESEVYVEPKVEYTKPKSTKKKVKKPTGRTIIE